MRSRASRKAKQQSELIKHSHKTAHALQEGVSGLDMFGLVMDFSGKKQEELSPQRGSRKIMLAV